MFMKRREFVSLLGVAAMWPVTVRAQQAGMPVVGFLDSGAAEFYPDRVAAFRQGLNESGYVEGQNVAIEYRWAQGRYDRLPALADELVRRQAAVIFAATVQAALPAKVATSTIPIVFAIGSDPVKYGLVASFNRPGGNITGTSWLGGSTLAPKRLELLREAVPGAAVIAALVNPTNPGAEAEVDELKETARTLGLQLQIFNASTAREVDAAFAASIQQRVGAVLVTADNFFFGRRDQLIVLAARHALPAIAMWREFAAAGGLMSYGASLSEAYRQAAVYVSRILKGEKPAELPVQQATKVELVINLKTAKALGLTFPITLLGRADEVIE
jgi:putative tryptophan/tyrosine transport system substrate-binding protein